MTTTSVAATAPIMGALPTESPDRQVCSIFERMKHFYCTLYRKLRPKNNTKKQCHPSEATDQYTFKTQICHFILETQRKQVYLADFTKAVLYTKHIFQDFFFNIFKILKSKKNQ